MKITPQEIADWRNNPTTVRVMELFNKRREDLKEILVSGMPHDSIQLPIVKGICEGYKDMLGVDYKYFVTEYDLETKEEEEDVDSISEFTDATS